MKDFNGKLAVVTGGASGVGFAIREALAKEGAKVVLADVEKESLESSTAILASNHLMSVAKLQTFQVLILCKDLAAWCQSNHGPVHLLFNNAGVAPAELFQFGKQNQMIGSGLMA